MPATFSADLTPSQREAVEHFEGPLLVLAGPGSGKTRVITRRIARLVQRGVSPWEILAITFTNKAAREMAERVQQLLPGERVWVSTFHRFCAWLLRRHAEAVGLQPSFTIYDTADQKQLFKGVMGDSDLDPTRVKVGTLLSRISRAKNRLQSPEEFLAGIEHGGNDFYGLAVARVYQAYQQALLAANAVDFDDLLLHAVRLLAENPELRSRYDERFRFILVDEYQDTNAAQYRLVTALAQDTRNLCVTGDPDQSIYGWRGAEIGNILRFESDYPQTRVVRLEENFRSTKSILRVADSLIAHNVQRKAKRLITSNPEGQPVELRWAGDAIDEADGIAAVIREEVDAGRRAWSDFAILYRVNALSRHLELALARARIPRQVAQGTAFYERAEVRDLLAYLRLIANPRDREAFVRIVNRPARGIGKQTVSKLLAWAEREGLSPVEAAGQVDKTPGLNRRAVAAVKRFSELLHGFSLADAGSVRNLLERVVETIGYTREWQGSHLEEDIQRLANVDELLSAASHYDEEAADETSLTGFLETTALVSDADAVDEAAGHVTLMTLHAAKGLEFPVIFIVGVEQNLIPHERAVKERDLNELEEERRLLFVGITRAKEELYLTLTRVRDMRGQAAVTIPSEFLQEMELVRGEFAGLSNRQPGDWLRDDEPEDECHDKSAADESSIDEEPVGDVERRGRGEKERRVTPAESAAPRRRRGGVMTGAELLRGRIAPADQPPAFKVGMTVRHPRNGVGRVVDVVTLGSWGTVTVEFADGERSSFVASKAPLQPVGLS